jgi:hypothetical protein
MKSLRESLPLIHAVVGRYLDGHDSFEDAARSLAGVLRQVREYSQTANVEPKPPTSGQMVRKLKPDQWTNPMTEIGGTIYGFSMAPEPYTAERNQRAHELYQAALELLWRAA